MVEPWRGFIASASAVFELAGEVGDFELGAGAGGEPGVAQEIEAEHRDHHSEGGRSKPAPTGRESIEEGFIERKALDAAEYLAAE